MTGAGIGYMQALEGRKQRAIQDIKQTKDRNEELAKLDAKWRAEGKIKTKQSVESRIEQDLRKAKEKDEKKTT